MHRPGRFSVFGGLWLACTAAFAAPPEPMPLEYFAGPSKFKTATISPDGAHIAVTFEEGDNEGKLAITTSDLETVTAVFAFGAGKHVGNARWLTDERLLMDNWVDTGYLDGRRQDRRTFIGSYDGKNRRALEAGRFFDVFVDALESDPKHFLMGRVYWPDFVLKLHRVDVNRGRADFFLGTPPVDDGAQITDVALDPEDHIRFAIERHPGKEDFRAEDDRFRLHYREPDGEWQALELETARNAPEYLQLGFGPGGRHLYFLSNYDQPGRDTLGVYRFDFDQGVIEPVFRHPEVDVESAIRGPRGEVLGVRYQPGYPTEHYFYPDHPVVKQLKSLQAAFPGQVVRATSFTRDGSRATVTVSSDRNPGELYLFEGGRLKFLAAARPGTDPERLGVQEAFTVSARDGMKLYGYLTLPPGRPDQNLPLVVFPHGGPHGPYDRWGFDTDVQFMASHGYAVLQVNFRGSGGYGQEFERAGYREWGRAMQDDLTDATRWAIDEGIADPERICIAGGSYGGYAALQGVVREPDLYQCAIGIVGVYSLPMMQKRGDYRMNPSAINEYFEDVQGTDREDLEARSPAYNVDRIKADLLIIHGSRDVRVPVEQAEFLRDQLDAAGKDYEWLVRKEGHGFSGFENRLDMYRTWLKFLDRNIGDSRDALVQHDS